MNRSTQASVQTTVRAASEATHAPRHVRVGAALASLVVTSALFGGVVLGMASNDGDPSLVAQAATAPRT